MKSTLATLAAATTVTGCFEHVDYPGQDIKVTENIHSAETCQAICRETEGCSTFTWSPSEGLCWSKYVAAGRLDHEGRVSGPAFCAGEVPIADTMADEGPCVEEGYDYFGNDIKSSDNVHSAEECKAQCQETEGCSFFTWAPSEGHCWSKFSVQGRRENSNRKSGRASCGDCFEHNIDYQGHDLFEMGVPASSVYNCQEQCQDNAACEVWSFHPEGACYLKTSKAGREVEAPFVSGAKFCEEPTMLPTALPTEAPTASPTEVPTAVPTEVPTALPTEVPTMHPTAEPTMMPTAEPTAEPTMIPTAEPTAEPTMEDACSTFTLEAACTVIGFIKPCQWIEGVCVTVEEMPAPAGLGVGYH